ncbi:GAF domain-containing protein [Trebonia kvetii]|uniref:GAF domain-containing protein n=1 Tax=Trebonia kvetii TaxID=2480626 RepID=A0A6P2C6W0_9ACTN|nr:GAF domain-containing SpoIIE family protein phosphatase [Trebonia kvetii]TVZ07172.1 GAF domain-containing protein [Trebonia kvetii]
MVYTSGPPEDARTTAADRLRDIEAVTDAALSRLDEQALLDTLLDRVKKTLQVDTAAVLLLDRSARQLVATAASGLEEEVVQGVRVPLGAGFAGRIAASREPVILTELNASTVSNPLLAERGIKSLLGVPLFAAGRVIGVLHVGSLSGRRFTQEDTELLQLAADRAALALRSLMAQDDQLAAVALHRSLHPAALPELPGHELAARYVTGTGNVGGDWYDVFKLPDGKLGIVVGDVAGSGLQAAVIMGRMRSALRAYVLETADPAVALRLLDRKIQYFEADAMATVLYGLYDPASGELRISSAGHPPPVIALPAELSACALPVRPDPPIGTADDPPRQSAVLTIPPGGLLCCYTDGLVERRDRAIDEGIGLLADTMRRQLETRDSRAGRPVSLADDTCAAVMRDLVGHAPARDDVAVLILHRKPSG